MVNISIDLTEKQLEFLREMYSTGQYRSRSEIIRDFIRRIQFEWNWSQAIKEVEAKGITMDDFEKARNEVSAELLKGFKYVKSAKHRR